MASERFDRIADRINEIIDREEKFEIFLDASPWGILVVDKTFHIAYINHTLEIMSGWNKSDVIGEHMHILLPKEDRKTHIAHEKQYIKNPHARAGNHGLHPRLLTRFGNSLDVEISISPTRVQGETYFFASIRFLESLKNTVGDFDI